MAQDKDSLTLPNVKAAEDELRALMHREGRTPTGAEVYQIYWKHAIYLHNSQNN